ncbi:hypothetical protein [Symbiopectobacterium purcellii]|uniref:Uncharacterized protein n=1 Tax=Symbiopectobacterium purcellii TaxID=2871826 RepID=A0ABX9AQ14_9ENTR|nr:hypothetical protein [Symbiopectobacterium purcellii]QZN97279.1 hypothetical protein K6K13_07995 [Symbiopectobacterium purcellii]
MVISIDQHRMRIGHYHQSKMKENAKRCNKKAPSTVDKTVKKIPLASNIKNIAPSYDACQQREHRLQLKQIICFILLLNHVRAHTLFAGESPDIAPSPLALNHATQTLPLLNERLRVKTETTSNHQRYADSNEKKTIERSEKHPTQ